MKKPSSSSSSSSSSSELDPSISRKIAAGEQLDLLIKPPSARTVQTVDFFSNTVRQIYSHNKYTIMLSSSIGTTSPVVCLFLNHKNHRKQVVSSAKYVYLSSFNKAINAAFSDSLSETDLVGTYKLCVCYRKHVYKCKDISGTVYIIWAEYVNRTNAGNVACTIYQNVPILLNFDGQARLKALFILKTDINDESDLMRIAITEHDPVILFNKDDPLFVCEVRSLTPREPAGLSIETLTYMDAVSSVSTINKETVNLIKRMPNHFASSIDVEEDYYESQPQPGPDQGSPRSVLYLKDVDIHRNFQTTPPIVPSDAEDPFAEK